ncbi:MAG: PD-(D/E)XK nuclease family protein [Anaerolineales bacterium]|nr:PD-(D/E)XK nuclease family protein [Anaerolineales bacterium]
MTIDDTVIEEFIRDMFEENLETLMFEGGQPLTRDSKEAALNQVLLYWRKLREVATRVTETEVKLNLPRQQSPNGKIFGIEGVVDIVREEGETLMYDIKSHDLEYVRANTDLYREQLNVYAYIWQELRRQGLDGTYIIATAYPDEIGEALFNGDEAALEYALSQWDPLVEIGYDLQQVQTTIKAFGAVVDAIEEGRFSPPAADRLASPLYEGSRSVFGRRICRLCDVRFSCSSYREYALAQGRGTTESKFSRYFNDYGDDLFLEVRRNGALEAIRGEVELL